MKRTLLIGIMVLASGLALAQEEARGTLSSSPRATEAASRMDRIIEAADARMRAQTDDWFDEGDFPQIIQVLRVRALMFPADYEVNTDLAWMLGNVDDRAGELAAYLTFIRKNPSDPDPVYALAQYYFLKRMWAKIPPLLEPLLSQHPRLHPNVYRSLATSYERMGFYRDAERVLNLFIKLYPEDERARANLQRVESKLRGEGQGT